MVGSVIVPEPRGGAMFIGSAASSSPNPVGVEFVARSSRSRLNPVGGAPVKIGNMLAVKVRYRQGVASQSGSESWAGGSNPADQALTGERIGWVLRRERG